jgi:hypothetical protein
MKKMYLATFNFLLILMIAASCENEDESAEIKAINEYKVILTSKPWFFFSINGGEGYDCVKQTTMNFLENESLHIAGYVREPDYTCSGPHESTHEYKLMPDNTKIKLGKEVYNIKKLTNTEFIFTNFSEGRQNEWVYIRKE